MSSAKELIIKPINITYANKIIKKYHYSGKVVPNSQIHLGVFFGNVCVGALQFGPSTDKRRMGKNLGIGMNEFLELNRMAIKDGTPKNTESRAISICIRIIKNKYPFIRMILSFADACQCGDGAIYRASGFKIIGIKKNNSLLKLSNKAFETVKKYMPSANRICSDKSLNNIVVRKSLDNKCSKSGVYLSAIAKKLGAKPIEGYQIKYAYFIEKGLEEKFKIIPFSKIDELGARMYKGRRASSKDSVASGFQLGEGGASPTDALQNN